MKLKPLSTKVFWRVYKIVPRVTVDIAVFNKKGEVLLVKRDIPPHKGYWHLPGGTIMFGERISHAAVRKAKDETGLKVKLEKLVGFWDDPKRTPKFHDITFVFRAKAVGGKLRGGWQGKELKFFKKVPRMFFDHNREAKIARGGKFFWLNEGKIRNRP